MDKKQKLRKLVKLSTASLMLEKFHHARLERIIKRTKQAVIAGFTLISSPLLSVYISPEKSFKTDDYELMAIALALAILVAFLEYVEAEFAGWKVVINDIISWRQNKKP